MVVVICVVVMARIFVVGRVGIFAGGRAVIFVGGRITCGLSGCWRFTILAVIESAFVEYGPDVGRARRR